MNAATWEPRQQGGLFISVPTSIPLAGNGTKGRLQLDKFVCRGEVVSERHLANSSTAACDARRVRIGRGEF